MHALSAIPASTARGLCPPRRRGLRAIARQVAVDLTPQAVEQVASRIVQLLHRQQQNQQHAEAREPVGMVTVAQLAAYYKLNPAWVYEHANELGAIRIGNGPKARIRIDFQTAKAAIAQLKASTAPAPTDTNPRRPRQRPETDLYSPDAPLLKSRPRQSLRLRSCAPQRSVKMRWI
jgi:hypothetical protein